jgi:hypothetical protein
MPAIVLAISETENRNDYRTTRVRRFDRAKTFKNCRMAIVAGRAFAKAAARAIEDNFMETDVRLQLLLQSGNTAVIGRKKR